ncbi:uncharacterized protein VTP21DRAFT_3723 [Calcarisporiella thermophila]|uniref:uncharacterized protein n=1 Tax=Calcarisporiella thermophila TaxID=911321 RepID=UPI003743BCAF
MPITSKTGQPLAADEGAPKTPTRPVVRMTYSSRRKRIESPPDDAFISTEYPKRRRHIRTFDLSTLLSRKNSSNNPNKTPTRAGSQKGPSSLDAKPVKRQLQQLYLDFGQKNVGPITCKECGMSYSHGTEDDKLHQRFHRSTTSRLEYPGYRSERVVSWCGDTGARIVLVGEGGKGEQQKAQEILEILLKETEGVSYREEQLKTCKTYLYIQGKWVVGCVVAESLDSSRPVTLASEHSPRSLRMDTPPLTSPDIVGDSVYENVDKERGESAEDFFTAPSPVRPACGISFVWVRADMRRHKIATRMLDTVRRNFVYGFPLLPSQLAFRHLTESLRPFAARYVGTDHFLVYNE